MKFTIRQKLLGSCHIVPIFLVCVVFLPVQSTETNIPTSFYVELEGELTDENDIFLLGFTNGTGVPVETLTINFSMIAKSEYEYNILFAVDSGVFFNEILLDGHISADGRLMINNNPSVFVISPNLLIDGDIILLEDTSDWQLIGEVKGRGKPSTIIEGQGVEAIMVHSNHIINSTERMPLILGFDPNTGILVSAALAFTDILIKEIGLDFIFGGAFLLASYSNNLDFKLMEIPLSPGLGSFTEIILVLSLTCFIVLTIVIYRAKKKGHNN